MPAVIFPKSLYRNLLVDFTSSPIPHFGRDELEFFFAESFLHFLIQLCTQQMIKVGGSPYGFSYTKFFPTNLLMILPSSVVSSFRYNLIYYMLCATVLQIKITNFLLGTLLSHSLFCMEEKFIFSLSHTSNRHLLHSCK